SLADAERDPVHGSHRPVGLGDVLEADQGALVLGEIDGAGMSSNARVRRREGPTTARLVVYHRAGGPGAGAVRIPPSSGGSPEHGRARGRGWPGTRRRSMMAAQA